MLQVVVLVGADPMGNRLPSIERFAFGYDPCPSVVTLSGTTPVADLAEQKKDWAARSGPLHDSCGAAARSFNSRTLGQPPLDPDITRSRPGPQTRAQLARSLTELFIGSRMHEHGDGGWRCRSCSGSCAFSCFFPCPQPLARIQPPRRCERR